jgi:hypothetical protein
MIQLFIEKSFLVSKSMKDTHLLGKPAVSDLSKIYDSGWFHLFLLCILPLGLIGVAWNLSDFDLFRGAIPFNVLLFFAIAALIEGAACLIWIFRERFSAQILALVAGIFVSALPGILSLFLLDRDALGFLLTTVIGVLLLIWILLETWGLSKQARQLALERLERDQVCRWMLLGCLASLLCCWSPYLIYSQVRPEIEEIPLFVAASDLESTDWRLRDSGGTIERSGSFITTASEEELLNSYKQGLEKQGWRLVETEAPVLNSSQAEHLHRLCCYSYWSSQGKRTYVQLSYTPSSEGGLVRIQLRKQ